MNNVETEQIEQENQSKPSIDIVAIGKGTVKRVEC